MSFDEDFINALCDDRKEAQTIAEEWLRPSFYKYAIPTRVLDVVTICGKDMEKDEGPFPVVYSHKEPGSPCSISIPLGDTPMHQTAGINNSGYPVLRHRTFLTRVCSIKFRIAPSMMRCEESVGSVLNALLLTILDEINSKFLFAVDNVVGNIAPTYEVTTNESGNIVLIDPMGINRSALCEQLKILPNRPSRLEAVTGVINQNYMEQMRRMSDDEKGAARSCHRLFGVNWLDMPDRWVQDYTSYLFADPKFVGKLFVSQDLSVHISEEKDVFLFVELGASIMNTNGVAKCRIAKNTMDTTTTLCPCHNSVDS